MNTLVGKIFEDRKNSNRKVVVKDYQVSANDIEVVTIEFLDGCGKKAGTVEDKFLKSFKKSWKETEEVIDDDITDEVIEKAVDETEKAEEVVDTEENLSDEDYAKIGVEIAEQAKKKSNNSKKNIVSKDERANVVREYLKSRYVIYKERFYSGERLKCIAIFSGKKKLAEIYPQRKSLAIYVSKLIDLSSIPTTHSDYFLCQRVDAVDISLLEKVIERLDL